MARSRREKSASISSSAAAPTVNGAVTMAPPSVPSSARSSPAATRRKASSISKAAANVAALPPPKSQHNPEKPSTSKFALAVLISMAAEAAGLTAAGLFGTAELASISKPDPDLYITGGMLIWKIALLGICWFGGLDAVDVASLNTLVQTPIFILLHYFYDISAPYMVTTCTISILAPALPFYLLRDLSKPHAGSAKTQGLRNRIIINDPVTTLATTATATIIYATTLQAAFSTFLPVFFATHFTGLRNLTFAHDIARTLPSLIIWLAPAGIASTQFLFRPAEGAASSQTTHVASGANSIALAHSHFHPETATFAQHVYHNVWGWYTSRQKELIGRTIVLGVFMLAETTVFVWGTVRGAELMGALGYAGLWMAGAVVLGVFLDWVGGPSD